MFVLIPVWIWVRFFYGLCESKDFSIGYNDCVLRRQWWRMLTSPFCHTSIVHLIINVSSIWCCRSIEKMKGPMFYLGYMSVVMICESSISLAILHFLARLARQQMGDGNPLANINLVGSSAIILAWLSYASLTMSSPSTPPEYRFYYFLGILPMSWLYAPLVLIFVLPFVIPRESAISNISGLASGYLLASGLIDILPDEFWLTCFFFNASIFFIGSRFLDLSPRTPAPTLDAQGEEVFEPTDFGFPDADDEEIPMEEIVVDPQADPSTSLASAEAETRLPAPARTNEEEEEVKRGDDFDEREYDERDSLLRPSVAARPGSLSALLAPPRMLAANILGGRSTPSDRPLTGPTSSNAEGNPPA